jgi:L-ascorbate metabolism protein UlaG (beta-lactamase superfamily)
MLFMSLESPMPHSTFSRPTLAFWLAIAALMAMSTQAFAKDLSAERLTWAGVKLVSGDTTVFIDAVGTDLWDGDAPEGLVPVTADTRRRYALITHTHNDHFDVDTLKEVLGDRGYVICHESIAVYVASRGLQVIPVKDFVPVVRGGFVFTAVPAVDGFGSEQVSWVVTVDGKRLLHGGDTLWHGGWPTVNMQFGPFDAVFLPINGARVEQDPMPVSTLVQTPSQAIDVALLLRAKVLVPIHFGLDDPPNYFEVDEPLETLLQEAEQRGQTVQHLAPGEELVWVD